MWNSKNGTSSAVMYLGLTYMLSIQGKNIFPGDSQKVTVFTCKKKKKKIENLT